MGVIYSFVRRRLLTHFLRSVLDSEGAEMAEGPQVFLQERRGRRRRRRKLEASPEVVGGVRSRQPHAPFRAQPDLLCASLPEGHTRELLSSGMCVAKAPGA